MKLVLGIDPDPKMMNEALPENKTEIVAYYTCNYMTDILNAVDEFVDAVKFNLAYFEAIGPAGFEVLQALTRTARTKGKYIIYDGKRGDIGNTARFYAKAYLGSDSPWDCDALTVNPFLGLDSLEPMVEAAIESGKRIFVLARTSNPGSSIQEGISERIVSWAKELPPMNVGLVVGATMEKQLREFREQLPDHCFLVPGVGRQGGNVQMLKDVGGDIMVNSSRDILYANNKDYARAAREAARKLKEEIN